MRPRPDLKNRIHSILDSKLFPLAAIFTGIFGVSGQYILHGILNGVLANDILLSTPRRTRAKKESEIRALIEQRLSSGALMQHGHILHFVKQLDEEISKLTEEALAYTPRRFPREYALLRTVPDVGSITAVTLLAEIGNFRDFTSGDHLASWLGPVPKVYQSANHVVKQSITKRDSCYARWILTQTSHAATKARMNVLRDWYKAKKAVIGAGKPIIPSAFPHHHTICLKTSSVWCSRR